CREMGVRDVRICTLETAPLAAFAPDVPLEVSALVQRALRIDPDRRPASAAEMLAAIQAVCPGEWSIDEDEITGPSRGHGPGEPPSATFPPTYLPARAARPEGSMSTVQTGLPSPGLSTPSPWRLVRSGALGIAMGTIGFGIAASALLSARRGEH